MPARAVGLIRQAALLHARALRLPFVVTGVLPFAHGAVLTSGTTWHWPTFLLGAATVVLTHLSANVVNDYADSRSGADAGDPRCFGFFGGSKLIQQGLLSPRHTLGLACMLMTGAVLAAVLLALLMRRPAVLPLFAAILAIGWAYTAPPLKLSYRGLGELTVGLLFGGATVMGGAFTQSERMFATELLFPACLHGFMVIAILLGNEIPDAETDRKAGKLTLVARVGAARGWRLFVASEVAAGICLAGMLLTGNAGTGGILALVAAWPIWRAARIMRLYPTDKYQLLHASRDAIMAHVVASAILITERSLCGMEWHVG